MILVGCDPGLNGAFALVGPDGIIDCRDMPTAAKARAKGDKRTVDARGVYNLLIGFKLYGATHLVVEEVNGVTGQSASAAFSFGFGAGQVYQAAVDAGFAIELVSASRWKGAMRVGTKPAAIRARANEVFPRHAHLWALPPRAKSENSEALLDRAEAALIGAYGLRILGAKS